MIQSCLGGKNLKVGVVLWAESNKVIFRILEGVRVERGDIYKVESTDGTIYVVKVVDFKPTMLFDPLELSRLSLKQALGSEVIFDKELRYYDTALAVIIAEIDNEKAFSPISVPRIFSPVKTIDDLTLSKLGLDKGDIELGYVRMGHKATPHKVKIFGREVFPHHILVASITGGGKTNVGKVIAWNILRQKKNLYSMVIVDTESEYFDGSDNSTLGLIHSRYSEKRLLYITPKVDKPCLYKYEFIFRGEKFTRRIYAYPLRINIRKLRPEDLIDTGEFTLAQETLLWTSWKYYEDDWLHILLEGTLDAIFTRLRRSIPKNTIAATQRKLSMMLSNTEIFTDEPTENDSLDAILKGVTQGKVILIDMPMALEAQEKLISVIVARRIFKFYEFERRYYPQRWEQLPTVLIFVEEAHKYLRRRDEPNVRGENIFTTISKRGRKYRIGLCTVTQMPGELEEGVIRQQLTKIILPLPTKPDYMKVVNYTPYLEDSIEEIRSLERGEALLISPPSGIRFAISLKIHKYEELVIKELKEELMERTRISRKYMN